jgi:serine protease Do/serine protease DegQ
MKRIALLTPVIISLALSSCIKAEDSEPAEYKQFSLIETPVDRSNSTSLTSYANMLDKVRPAVVSVTSESIVRSYRRGDPRQEMLRRLFGIPDPRQESDEPEERRVPNGLGSGVIVSDDGYILTNNHVVVDESGDAADTIMVQLFDDKEFEAELIGRDPRTDIALLKIDAEDLPFVPMADSENLFVGDIVFAIGNPLGVGQTTTMGIVSATGRNNLHLLGAGGYEDFIQTDAAINRGNSGGALVDAEGRLVGINSAIISPVGANIGIGFAIPSRIARTIADELVKNGEIRRGFLGVSIRNLDDDLAEAFNLESTNGVLIESVQEGMPADMAGIKRGDIVTHVDGKAVSNVDDLRFQVAGILPGTVVPVKIIRAGEEQSLDVTLTSLDDPLGDGSSVGISDLLEGVRLSPNNEDRQHEWNLDTSAGIIVTEVDARSPYSKSLSEGMVILEVNRSEVNSIKDLRRVLRKGANSLFVSYRGSKGYVVLRLP